MQKLNELGFIRVAAVSPEVKVADIEFNKNEIINIARNIGTIEISNQQEEDTCTLFTPKHPNAGTSLKDIKAIEESINIEELEIKLLEKIEVMNIGNLKPMIAHEGNDIVDMLTATMQWAHYRCFYAGAIFIAGTSREGQKLDPRHLLRFKAGLDNHKILIGVYQLRRQYCSNRVDTFKVFADL